MNLKERLILAKKFILQPFYMLFDGLGIPWRMPRSEVEVAYAKRDEVLAALGRRVCEVRTPQDAGLGEDVEGFLETYRDGEWRTLMIVRRTPEGELVNEWL